MNFQRMLIEKESPEQYGYDKIKYNLSESSTSDKTMQDVGIRLSGKLLLCYGDHLGKPELRELLAARYGVDPTDVTLTVGACMALFIVYSAILNPGDHLLVMQPNYPANLAIPKSLGCIIDTYQLKFENQFRFNLLDLERKITEKTKIVSITFPHNPTGIMISDSELIQLAKICDARGIWLIVDETYGQLTRGQRLPYVCNLTKMGICIESLSKAIGVPGIRTGWIVTKNKKLQDLLVTVKEQVCICGSVVDEECGYQVLLKEQQLLEPIRKDLNEKFDIVKKFMASQDMLEWVEPEGGVICFPHIRNEIKIDTDEFYDSLINKFGVYVGPGHWFDMDDRFFRLGYAWPDKQELFAGLQNLLLAIKSVRSD